MERKKLGRKAEPSSKLTHAWTRWTGFRGMTLGSWLELLVVPLALVVLGFLFSVQQDVRPQRIENQRAEAEQELAKQRAQDEALQAYLDQMRNLLLEKDLRDSEEGSEVRTLARARTLTLLPRLDPAHRNSVMHFLEEASLIQAQPFVGDPIISLDGANLEGITLGDSVEHTDSGMAHLEGVNLSGSDLSNAALQGAQLGNADLRGANLGYTSLRQAQLSGANLADADLTYADLNRASLSSANLRGANLSNADLSMATMAITDLTDADLTYADLSEADLTGADLTGANLRAASLVGADLNDAKGVSELQLAQVQFLDGATMPDGQTLKGYETPNRPTFKEWLKDKEGDKEK